MPKVELPRADWETLLMILEDAINTGMYHKTVIQSLHDDIDNQVYSQEY